MTEIVTGRTPETLVPVSELMTTAECVVDATYTLGQLFALGQTNPQDRGNQIFRFRNAATRTRSLSHWPNGWDRLYETDLFKPIGDFYLTEAGNPVGRPDLTPDEYNVLPEYGPDALHNKFDCKVGTPRQMFFDMLSRNIMWSVGGNTFHLVLAGFAVLDEYDRPIGLEDSRAFADTLRKLHEALLLQSAKQTGEHEVANDSKGIRDVAKRLWGMCVRIIG